MEIKLKKFSKPIILPLAFAGLFWLLESILDSMFFYDRSFAEVLLLEIPPHEIYIRLLVMAFILLFGLIISLYNRNLQKEKERYFTILKSIGDAVISTDTDGLVEHMNPVAEEITGWSEKKAQGQPIQKIFNIVNAKTGAKVKNPVYKVLKEGRIVGLANHTVLISEEGQRYQIADSGAPVKDEDGNITGVVLVFRDVTEEYKMQKEIRENKEKLEKAQAVGKMGSWQFNLNTGKVKASKEAYRIYGLEPGRDLTIKYIQKIPLPEYREMLDKNLEELIRGKSDYNVEFKIERPEDRKIIDIHSIAEYYPEENIVVGIIQDVTELKKAEEDLRRSERKYRALFNSIRDAIVVADTSRKIINCNPAFSSLFGYSLDQIRGNKTATLYENEEEFQEMGAKIADNIDSTENFIYTVNYRKKSGQVFPGETNVFYLKDDDGEIAGFIGLIRDITERKQAEEALQKRKNMMARTEKIASVGSWEWNVATDTTIWSDELFRIFNMDPDQEAPSFAEHSRLYHADDMPKLEQAVGKALEEGTSYELELRAVRTDGKLRHCLAQGHPEIGTDGEVTKLYGFVQDITERKMTEQDLEFQAMLLNQIQDHITATDLEGNIIYVNQAELETFGLSRDELIGKSITEYGDDPSMGTTQEEILNETLQKGEWRGEVANYTPEGRKIIFDTRTKLIRDEEGNPISMIGISTDITKRKNIEKELRKTHSDMEQIFNAAVPLCAIGKDYKMLKVNDTYCSYFQIDREDVIGERCYDVWQGEYCHKPECSLNKVLEGRELYKYETTRSLEDGSQVSCIITAIPYHSPSGELIGVIESFTDITERKIAERELNRVNDEIIKKNKKLEQLLYATSHDLRSPLINVQGFNKELKASLDQLENEIAESDIDVSVKEEFAAIIDQDINDSLHYILSSTSKMDDLLTGLLALSRLGRQKLSMKKLDMNQLIEKVVENFEYEIKEKKVDIIVEELPDCKGDQLQINQVFSNLLNNAIKYMDSKRDAKIKIYGEKDNNQVYYHVEDNGIGIPRQQQQKIFRLFHKLDPEKPGIGLGLNIIKQILDRHNGHIKVDSDEGKGSKFTVSMPT